MITNKYLDLSLLLGRLFLGGLMLIHGITKIDNIATVSFLKGVLIAKGLPEELYFGIFLGEVIAPILIIIGFLSRISSIIIIFTMLFAMFLANINMFVLSSSGGSSAELNLLYISMALFIFLNGSGKYSLSNIFKTK